MQTVTALIPTPLRDYADGKDRVELVAATVREALEGLTARHPGLKRHLFADDGRLRRYVNIYLNDADIRYLEGGERARLQNGDELRIVPSIAGGAATLEAI
jgi:molybdopterin converting factor small subunit